MHNSEIRCGSDFENVCVHVLAVVLGPTRHSCVSFPCTRARVPHELSWKDTRLTSTIVILTTRYPHDVQHEELKKVESKWTRKARRATAKESRRRRNHENVPFEMRLSHNRVADDHRR